jgi:hypothetical protein
MQQREAEQNSTNRIAKPHSITQLVAPLPSIGRERHAIF